MARESSLWQWLAKARLIFKTDLHMHRIENPASPGMPDVEGFLHAHVAPTRLVPGCIIKLSGGGQFWLELKSAARPARVSTPIRFEMRPKQIEWARRRWNIGGACYWLLQVGDGGSRKIYLLPGRCGKEIEAGLTEAQLQALNLLDDFEPVTAEGVIRIAHRGIGER